jgi:hypothetical protein
VAARVGVAVGRWVHLKVGSWSVAVSVQYTKPNTNKDPDLPGHLLSPVVTIKVVVLDSAPNYYAAISKRSEDMLKFKHNGRLHADNSIH